MNLCILSGESTWSKGRYSGPDPLTDKTIGNPVTERDTRAARGNLIEVNGIGAAGKTIIEAARAGGHRELSLVAAQSELIAPTRNFEAEALVS